MGAGVATGPVATELVLVEVEVDPGTGPEAGQLSQDERLGIVPRRTTVRGSPVIESGPSVEENILHWNSQPPSEERASDRMHQSRLSHS